MVLALDVQGLGFSYGDTAVLRDISLPAVRSGEVTALIGPNATGKSTLLRCIAGIHSPTGVVRVGDESDAVPPPSPGARSRWWTGGGRGDDRVLYTPQETPPPSSLTVFEAVLMARQRQVLGRVDPELVDQIGRVLVDLELADLAVRPISDLSGGQRQIVSLAQAVVRRPAVMLLDEPTSNLDLRNQLRILTLIRRIAVSQPAAVLVTVHDLALAARFADRVVVLHGGTVHSEGRPQDVITEDMLRDVYQIDATVQTTRDGVLSVAATRSL